MKSNYIETKQMTFEESVEMFMKPKKRELAEMLAERDRITPNEVTWEIEEIAEPLTIFEYREVMKH